jgi:hypothetical protein
MVDTAALDRSNRALIASPSADGTMRRFRWPLIGAAVLLVAGLAGYSLFGPGVRVTLFNTGKTTMRDVAIHVPGQTCKLGDIPPGHFCTQKMSPGSKAHVEVEFTDEHGQRVRLPAGGYFEPGSRGHIDIEIKSGTIVAVKQDVRRGVF